MLDRGNVGYAVRRPTVLFCSDEFWDERGDDIVSIDPTIEVVRLVGDEHVTPSDLERITVAFFSPDTVAGAMPGRSWRPAHAARTCVAADVLAGTDNPVFGRCASEA